VTENKTPEIRYPFVVEQVKRSDGELKWEAEILDLPGCVAVADSLSDLGTEVSLAIQDWITVAEQRGMTIPEPSSKQEYGGKVTVRMSPDAHRRAAIVSKYLGISLNSYIVNSMVYRLGQEQRQVTQVSNTYLMLSPQMLSGSDMFAPGTAAYHGIFSRR
jgi:predicted HicB family RNase H-like nuclease